MKIHEFRELKEEEKVQLANKRLAEMKEQGLDTKQFKSEMLEFSYATLMSEMQKINHGRVGNEFVKELKLTEYQLTLLTNLADGYEFVMREQVDEPKVYRRPDDSISTTSVRMYNQVWKRWQEFSKEWGIYNSVDLMASALEEMMNKHNFEDYETLVAQGKIKPEKKKKDDNEQVTE